MKIIFLIVGIWLFMVGIVLGQYEPGDIAIVRYNTDAPDGFSFVALTSIASGDSIFFTDEGWDDTAGLIGWRVSGEEHLKYISPGLDVGDVVHIEESSPDNFTVSGAGGSVSLARGSGFSLISGDQIIAYDGLLGVRPDNPTFLTALHGDDGAGTASGNNDLDTKWTANGELGSSTAHSALPTGLINGVTAISVFGRGGTEVDNMIYNCSVTSETKSGLLVAINDSTNWTTSDGTNQPAGSACSFTVNSNSSTIVFGDEGWRMLSLPKTGGVVADVSDDSPVQGVAGGSDVGFAANFFINTASDGNTQNGYTTPTNVTTAWGDGLGFVMYFYNNTANGSSVLPIALDVSGSEPATDVTVGISNTYTLLGNPFQSNIELDAITGNGSGGVNSGFISPISIWSDSGSTWTTLNFGESAEINDWTGFFLERDDATSLTIPTSAKTDSTFHITHSKNNTQGYRSIELVLNGEEYVDRSTKLYFTHISSEGKDGFDGTKLNPFNNAPHIYFAQDFGNGVESLVQDARAFNLTETQEYQLDFNDMGVSGDFSLSWPVWKNIPSDWSFILKDEITGIEVDMKLVNDYTFMIESKQKRPVTTVLAPPTIKAKSLTSSTPRFSIKLIPSISVSNESETKPERFALEQNYPNPFNPNTTIKYSLEESGLVSLAIYNVVGQRVAELVNEVKASGTYTINWNASGMSSGVYYYRLVSGNDVQIRKMTLIK